MKVVVVAGTRPELIRLVIVLERLREMVGPPVLVHTGQNFDDRLSQVFFDELPLPRPDHFLGVRAPTVGGQIAQVIERSERVLLDERPDALLVLGDTNSALSAIAAARHDIPVFHMEAGNRCFDWEVPEEKNRRLVDHISDWLMPYTPGSREHLLREGIAPDRIVVTGNPITEVLERFGDQWRSADVLSRLELDAGGYVLVTAHRQEIVDRPVRLAALCDGLEMVARDQNLPIVWSVHPRTRERLAGRALDPAIQLHAPFGFTDFVALEAGARCVVTDSGTVQEECSLLGVPTVTCRRTTERPETVACGSNVLSGVEDPERIVRCVRSMLRGSRAWTSPYAGDGEVADRVVKTLVSSIS